MNLQAVLIKNQATALKATNGSWTNREKYTANSNIRYIMTSPIDGSEVFGILTIQYTYRFIGKTRGNEGVHYDMSKIEDVRRAYIANKRPAAENAVSNFIVEP